MDTIINQIISNFDFAYMFVVNILTYILIKIVDWANGDKVVPIWQKRLLLIISIIIVTCVYISVGYDNKIILVNSSIVAPIAWSWILRPIFNKLGAGYRQPK
ncbi:MAG: hypothetical protein [Bacteriophage sp.]|nr:MAG: hypothetical protein [Bacteriophage sp.]